MKKTFEAIKKEGIATAASLLALSARTAPKTRGMDNLEIIIVDGADIEKLRKKMTELSEQQSRPSFKRDALSLKNSEAVLIIGSKIKTAGLNCGFCNFTTCKELEAAKGVCAYNSMDLGIALGSVVAEASDMHIDNRIMFSIGKASLALGLFSSEVKMAIGIPLAATGKNPFFDRQ